MKKKAKQQIMQKKSKELAILVDKKREEIAKFLLKQSDEKNKNLIGNLKKELAITLTALKENVLIEENQMGGDEA